MYICNKCAFAKIFKGTYKYEKKTKMAWDTMATPFSDISIHFICKTIRQRDKRKITKRVCTEHIRKHVLCISWYSQRAKNRVGTIRMNT
jgi:hypothetical protein